MGAASTASNRATCDGRGCMLLRMDNSTYNRFPTTVVDRLFDEGLLSVVEAARAENIQISAKTAIRWCLAGVRGARLEALKVGGAWRTSRAAIRRFVAASQPRPTAATQVMTAEAAERVLAAHGLGRRGNR
jgi:Protein of unknown function (DUF1580)